MKMLKHIVPALILAVGMPCVAQTTQKLTANKLSEYGLIYSLPLTGVNVTVEVECTEKTPGPFFSTQKISRGAACDRGIKDIYPKKCCAYTICRG